tara:strand:+ start:9393 stop:10481 length:1089 start_codon:yes stop_codon:yes gene_type:complete
MLRFTTWILSPMCLLTYIYFSDLDHREVFDAIMKILLIFFCIQLPIILFQSIPGSLLNWGPNPDFYTGTFGSSGTAFISFLSTIVFYFYLYKTIIKDFSRVRFFLISLLLVFYSIYCDISFTLYACLMSPIFYLLLRDALNIKFHYKQILRTVFFVVIVTSFFLIPRLNDISKILATQNVTTFSLNRLNFDDLSSYSQMIWVGSDGGIRFGRSLGISFSILSVMQSDYDKMIFGYGPGSTRFNDSSTGLSTRSSIRPVPQTNFFGVDLIIVEFGLFGLICFFYLFYFIIYNLLLHKKYLNKEMKIFIILFIIYFLYGSIYDGGWFFNSTKNGLIWALAALCFYEIDLRQLEKNKNISFNANN